MLESLFNKAAGLQTCNFIKKRLQHRCFSMNIAKFLRTTILKNNSERLLLFYSIFRIFRSVRSHKVQMCFKYFSKAQIKMQNSVAIGD